MVIATGMDSNPGAIEGLDDAWADLDHPVYANQDHPSWRGNDHPYQKWHYNYTSGDAIFCIPPYPYTGEIECFNFFTSCEVWDWYKRHGKLSPLNSFTIMNANDTFCHHSPSADSFIK